MQKLKISIVIPNWNGRHLLEKHLPKVIAYSPGCEIIITDDGSVDDSVAYIKKNFPRMHVVQHPSQSGFAGNVNRGVNTAGNDIIILLNTDVEPEYGWLEPLIAHFQDKNVFAVGCLEKSHEKDGIILRGRGLSKWSKGFFFHSKGETNKTTTAWVCGGSGAFRKTMWDQLGGMDELYNPFYWEDIDLSYRAAKAGYRLVFEPKSIIHHWHEEGPIKSKYSKNDVMRIVQRNAFIFHWKNISSKNLFFIHVLSLIRLLLVSILHFDTKILYGFFQACKKIPGIISKRHNQKIFWKIDDELLVLDK